MIAAEQTRGRAGGAPAGLHLYIHARGEAVPVDLSGGQSRFALLRSESNNDWAAGIVPALAVPSKDRDGAPR